MKRSFPAGWLLLAGLMMPPAFAQEDGEDASGPDNGPPGADATETVEDPEGGNDEQVGDEEPQSPDDISRAFEDFEPSAQISEDLSVAFPVDI